MTAPRSADAEALDAFVEQLIETSFTLMTLANAIMTDAAERRSSPDAPPIPDVLRSLLLDAATKIVCRDIYIVPRRASRGPPRRRARGPH